MFDFIKQNVLKRYSREKLSEMYGVKLPDRVAIYEKMKNVGSVETIKSNCYDLLNKNKFIKLSGEKCEIRVSKEQNLILINSRLGWFQKLIAMFMMMINGLIEKIRNFLDNLILRITVKIPTNLINIVVGVMSLISALIFIPFLILKALLNIFVIARNHMNGSGITGFLLGFIIGILMFFLQLILIGISVLLAPIMNKIVDSVIMKDCIKKMIIGHFVIDNNYDGTIVISSDMVSNVTYEKKSSLLGKESLYIVIKEGKDNVTLIDKIKAFIVPTYFVNKQTVIVTELSNQDKFDNVFKI